MFLSFKNNTGSFQNLLSTHLNGELPLRLNQHVHLQPQTAVFGHHRVLIPFDFKLEKKLFPAFQFFRTSFIQQCSSLSHTHNQRFTLEPCPCVFTHSLLSDELYPQIIGISCADQVDRDASNNPTLDEKESACGCLGTRQTARTTPTKPSHRAEPAFTTNGLIRSQVPCPVCQSRRSPRELRQHSSNKSLASRLNLHHKQMR